MPITVRRAGKKDIPALLKLLEEIAAHHHRGRPDIFRAQSRKYSQAELETLLGQPARPVFVAVEEHVLGYVFCAVQKYENHPVFKDYTSLYIDDFCVAAPRRGQGAGRLLFEAARALAKEAGAYNIELNVWEFNESALRFYQRCGMQTQRRRMELIL